MSEDKEKIKKRSERMVRMFQKWKGKELKNVAKLPFMKWLNGIIRDVKRGYAELEFMIRVDMVNPAKILHGGIQCTMLDSAIGMAAATLGYEGFPISTDLHVDYIGKVKVGERVKVLGKIINEGQNIIHAIGKMYDMKNNLISTCNSKLLKTHIIPLYVKEVERIAIKM